ncbi:MAG: IS110 family transposase [Bacillota bacterium]
MVRWVAPQERLPGLSHRCCIPAQQQHSKSGTALAGPDPEIEEQMRPFAEIQERLDEIPGVYKRAAQVIVAEIGVDMDRFPTSGHLASWAGMCPGNNESAGIPVSAISLLGTTQR